VSAPATFPAALAAALREDPARPLVTFYDDATGERVELSVTTYANWVAKTASLVQDELDLERGDVVLLDLPTHWLGPVWLGALWSAGQVATTDPAAAGAAALVVTGPDRLDHHSDAHSRGDALVVGLSLRPLGAPFDRPLPPGALDYGAVVLAQPDSFLPLEAPGPDAPAWLDPAGVTSHSALLAAADGAPLVEQGGRLLTDQNPCHRDGPATLLGPLLRRGGTVWVRRPDPAVWERRRAEERITAEHRVGTRS
jgi:uncharacterized protein (TIGR03089 family)